MRDTSPADIRSGADVDARRLADGGDAGDPLDVETADVVRDVSGDTFDTSQMDTGSDTGSCASQNDAPVASFTYAPSSPSLDDTVIFDASDSCDPDGQIQFYSWDVTGDGSEEYPNQTTSSIVHGYSSVGTYNVTLTVTDEDGNTELTSKSLTVSE